MVSSRRYAHLINIELVIDLLDVLRQLVGRSTLSFPSVLHCLIAAFETLSGPGQVQFTLVLCHDNDVRSRDLTLLQMLCYFVVCFLLVSPLTQGLSIEVVDFYTYLFNNLWNLTDATNFPVRFCVRVVSFEWQNCLYI